MVDEEAIAEHKITITLGCVHTDPKEKVLVVGSHDTLGLWDPAVGLPLATDEQTNPMWTASMRLPLGNSAPVEYKYVRDCSASGGGYVWEEGENRILAIPPDEKCSAWTVYDDAFGCQGTLMRCQGTLMSALAGEMLEGARLEMLLESDMTEMILESDMTVDAPTNRQVSMAETYSEAGESSSEAGGKSSASMTATTCSSMQGMASRGGEAKNIPNTFAHGDEMQRLASLSALDQLVDDVDEMMALRGLTEEAVEQQEYLYDAKHLTTPIIIVSSEMHPWSKTGGLAVIAASYAREFSLRGHRTMAISPMYDDYAGCVLLGSANIELAGGWHEVRYFHQQKRYSGGKVCDYIFVDHPSYHRGEGIYGPPDGEYQDNLFRFALLSIAAAEAPLVLEINGSTYGQDVLFICNDWQTGLLPVYMLYKYKFNKTYENARSLVVIHNIGYQGKYSKDKFPVDSYLGLPPRLAGEDLRGEDMHLGDDCINLLAGGIRTADRVLTVSPNYANEIQTQMGSNGLHDDLSHRAKELRLTGILNGISHEWSPTTDPHILRNYCLNDFEEGKRLCKAALQKELGLDADPDACLIGFCGRLCFQKGIKLILATIEWMMYGQGSGRCQLIIMGKGEQCWAGQVAEAERSYHGKVCGYVGFDPCVEHRMMAGCDVILMPSQYEPCGLPQMYAQMYGALPVVHETGGLKDSVRGLWNEDHDKDSATGFLFSGFSEDALRGKLHDAIWTYHHKKSLFKRMQGNAMRSNYYWPHVIDQYEQQIDFTMEKWPTRKPESWWTNHF